MYIYIYIFFFLEIRDRYVILILLDPGFLNIQLFFFPQGDWMLVQGPVFNSTWDDDVDTKYLQVSLGSLKKQLAPTSPNLADSLMIIDGRWRKRNGAMRNAAASATMASQAAPTWPSTVRRCHTLQMLGPVVQPGMLRIIRIARVTLAKVWRRYGEGVCLQIYCNTHSKW